MARGKPLFASDRVFVRDVCGEYPFYFDPLDAASIAATIAGYFGKKASLGDRLSKGRALAYGFSNARKRAEDYMKIIRSYC